MLMIGTTLQPTRRSVYLILLIELLILLALITKYLNLSNEKNDNLFIGNNKYSFI